MRIVFAASNGHIYVEKAAHRFKLIEEPDGFHPMTNESIWTHDGRVGESFVLIWQGTASPEGNPMTKDFATQILKEDAILKVHRGKMTVSRLWSRKLMAYLMLFVRFLYFVGFVMCISFFGYVLWLVFL